jgi:thiol-disulfide isomerase/thioredoxin
MALGAFGSEAHDSVAELTTATFETAVAGNRVLLEHYATWCTHCRKFETSYGRVAETLAKDGIAVARTDGSANRFLSMRFKVTGFPSFYYMESGRVWEYTGDRTVDGLVSFAKSGGEMNGKELKGMSAPFGAYWKLASAVVDVGDHIVTAVHDRKLSTPVLLVAVLLSFVLTLLSFAVFIHYATKPQPRPKQS